jgi:hypothetical protein
MRSDATRFFRGGVLTLVFETGGSPALARVRQGPDGPLAVLMETRSPDEALAHLRFIPRRRRRPFAGSHALRRGFLLGPAIRTQRGLRPSGSRR